MNENTSKGLFVFYLTSQGHEELELRGINLFQARLDDRENVKHEIEELLSSSMDEKRNFISYALTIVTTLVVPMAVLTGYL